jgi:hypothetical protein
MTALLKGEGFLSLSFILSASSNLFKIGLVYRLEKYIKSALHFHEFPICGFNIVKSKILGEKLHLH